MYKNETASKCGCIVSISKQLIFLKKSKLVVQIQIFQNNKDVNQRNR